jgi:hypothetical protein
MQLDEGGEGGVDLAFGADSQDMEPHPLRARRFLEVSDHAYGTLRHLVRALSGFTVKPWPGSSRPSANCRIRLAVSVDVRHKAGHDDQAEPESSE